ncbi:V-type proton ATPase subunit F [Camellia lanceoleosa]|uniref:V-type proton ATPase subunit F n=1 Tax=Camellia lanceoleosa TaxID=1840588 RepID=A0ACC0IFX4_9ERIC|nr:V-type proton ATPase subunit F [Camellia lanceoleosa]
MKDTITGFLLAGVGNVDLRRTTNYLIVDSKTIVKQIEEAFKEFTTREDVAIVMIDQYVSFYFFGQIYEMKYMKLDTSSVDFVFQMLVDDIGDVTITNDGAIILKMLYVEHPAAKSSDPVDNDAWKDSDREA